MRQRRFPFLPCKGAAFHETERAKTQELSPSSSFPLLASHSPPAEKRGRRAGEDGGEVRLINDKCYSLFGGEMKGSLNSEALEWFKAIVILVLGGFVILKLLGIF